MARMRIGNLVRVAQCVGAGLPRSAFVPMNGRIAIRAGKRPYSMRLTKEENREQLVKIKELSEYEKNRSLLLPVLHEGSRESRFGKMWLRENCRCSKCLHPATRQRLVDTFSIPSDIKPLETTKLKESVRVEWSDGHCSHYSYEWLMANQPLHRPDSKTEVAPDPPYHFRDFQAWDTSLGDNLPTVAYQEVMEGDPGLFKWLDSIYKWGFCFVEGVPVNPESTEQLLRRIAFVRHTHYGGFWDFTADMTFKDTAYTTEFLGAHTDNTYFTDPARLQLFHLLSHTEGQGGASLLVDGFQAARILLQESPENAKTLMLTNQPSHSSGNEDVVIQPAEQFPVLRRHPWLQSLYQIRWNNYDRAPKNDWTIEEQERWYDAARHFDQIIRRKNMEIWTQLRPGTALIFDNWRMLHGRSEFTGKRRMCGGYINNDDFISKYRLLRYGRENVLKYIGNFNRTPENPNFFI